MRKTIKTKRGGNATYARCKGYGHHWDDAPALPSDRRPPTGYGDMHFRCSECLTRKRVRLEMSTGTSRTRYWHPDDWQNVTDTRSQWKLDYYRQVRRNGS